MIGDRDLTLRRDSQLHAVAGRHHLGNGPAAGARPHLRRRNHAVEDDHMPFLAAGVPSVDLIDLDTYPYWHTADDTIDKLSPRSLQVVGDVVISALPDIEKRLASNSGPPRMTAPIRPPGTRHPHRRISRLALTSIVPFDPIRSADAGDPRESLTTLAATINRK